MIVGTWRALVAAVVAAVGVVGIASPADAQGWNYPSFQVPYIVPREFNFAVADGGSAGTHLLGQWRELLGPGLDLSVDFGFVDPDGPPKTRFLIGGGGVYQLMRSTREVPLDLALTGGLYGSFGDPGSLIRLPIGATIGHRFPLEGGISLTPYAHPRVSLDFCSRSLCGSSDTEVNLNFDLGAELEVSRQIALRFSALFSGGNRFLDDNGFGVSVAWRPPGLRR